MGNLKKCGTCSTYTLAGSCPECGGDTANPAPPKFSIPDKYGDQRRESKRRSR